AVGPRLRTRSRRGLPRARGVHGATRMSRTAEITRSTAETEISLSLDLDGTGQGERETGVGFLDHMLDSIARHGRLNLDLRARGDLETGPHHTVEDAGNDHHVVEAACKAVALALRRAVALDATEAGIPSTKGLL